MFRNNVFYQAISIASAGRTLRSFKGDLSSMGNDPSRQLIRALLYEGRVNVFAGRYAHLKDAALRMVRDGYVALSGQREVEFLSPMHERWYRHEYFSQQLHGLPLWKEGTLKQFIKVAIERMSSQQLKQSRSIGVDGDLLERAYQMEFYTAVQSLLPEGYGMSADVGQVSAELEMLGLWHSVSNWMHSVWQCNGHGIVCNAMIVCLAATATRSQ